MTIRSTSLSRLLNWFVIPEARHLMRALNRRRLKSTHVPQPYLRRRADGASNRRVESRGLNVPSTPKCDPHLHIGSPAACLVVVFFYQTHPGSDDRRECGGKSRADDRGRSQWQSEVIQRVYPLRRFLSGSDHSAVRKSLTGQGRSRRSNCAIKISRLSGH